MLHKTCDDIYLNRYTPINKTWQKISTMRVPRDVCGVCSMVDRIYLVGGHSVKPEDAEIVEVYDPEKDEWTQVGRAQF